MRRINLLYPGESSELRVELGSFLLYWASDCADCDADERFFRVLKQPQQSFVCREDLAPMVGAALFYD